jgi:L-malate glycosyltransferase
MIKVCHLISGDLWAGAEAMNFNLIKRLMGEKDLEISAILLNNGRLADKIRKLGIHVVVINENEISFLKLYFSIKKTLRQIRPDIIHSHKYKEKFIAYLFSRSNKEIKLIATQHGMPELYGKNRNLKYQIINRMSFFILSKYFQVIVPVSRDIKNYLVNKYGFNADKVKLIHNCVEIPYDALPNRITGTLVIGSAGRFSSVKDYPLMVEIARAIFGRQKNISFELVGDGPDKPIIENMIQKYGLKKSFTLPGFESHMSAFYKRIDVFINTSLHEGIPLSVLEAMSYGVPVVAPKVGGLQEIIEDNVQGFLIEGRNPEDFARKCLKLYENVSLRNKMGSAARERVIKEFSLERMANEYYQLYLDVMNIK